MFGWFSVLLSVGWVICLLLLVLLGCVCWVCFIWFEWVLEVVWLVCVILLWSCCLFLWIYVMIWFVVVVFFLFGFVVLVY